MKHPIGQKSASHEFTIWFHTLEIVTSRRYFVWVLLDSTPMTPSKSVSKKKRSRNRMIDNHSYEPNSVQLRCCVDKGR